MERMIVTVIIIITIIIIIITILATAMVIMNRSKNMEVGGVFVYSFIRPFIPSSIQSFVHPFIDYYYYYFPLFSVMRYRMQGYTFQ